MSAICIIPARGGSVRIPRKNIKMFHGKPIISYSIKAAIDSQLFDDIVVATDCKETAKIAKRFGATHIVETEGWWAGGVCGTQDVVSYVYGNITAPADRACCLYATAPMVSPEDMRRANWCLDEVEDLGITERGWFAMAVGNSPLRDCGQFYFGRFADFHEEPLISEKTRLVVVPEHRICDINTPNDWSRAERMYSELHNL